MTYIHKKIHSKRTHRWPTWPFYLELNRSSIHPLKSQALYGEAWKQEAWEDEKELEDLERFIWDKSGQKEAGLRLYRSSYPDNAEKSDEELVATPELTAYREAVEELVNYGETDERMAKYKAAVKKLMAVGE